MPPRASLSTGFGLSQLEDTGAAVMEAVRAAKVSVPSPVVALVTCAVSRPVPVVFDAVSSLLPAVSIHGATTCASPLTTSGSAPGGVAVLLLGDADVATAASSASEGGFAAGRQAAERLARKMGGTEKVANVILQATPGIEEDVLKGVADVLGTTPVFGGSAADDTVEGNWRLMNSETGVMEGGVSLVGLGADVGFGACLLPPYTAGEKEAKITGASGRSIQTLNGRRAADVLREWVGESIDTQAREGGNVIVECAAFPLGVRKENGAFVGIHAAEIDASGAVGLFAEVSEGETLTVMDKMGEGDSATAAKIGLEQAYQTAVKNGKLSDPKAGLLIYCGGLSIAVGDQLDASLEALKGKPPMLGMTAFGEQGNVDGCNVHSNLAVGIALFE